MIPPSRCPFLREAALRAPSVPSVPLCEKLFVFGAGSLDRASIRTNSPTQATHERARQVAQRVECVAALERGYDPSLARVVRDGAQPLADPVVVLAREPEA